VYVEKLLYENYKDFLQETYESYRRKKSKKTGWIIYGPESEDVLEMICPPLTKLKEASVERSRE